MHRRSLRRPSPLPRRAREGGLILTLLLIGLLVVTAGAVWWATARGTSRDLASPPSRLASCTLLADNAFLEGKGRLLRTLDQHLRAGTTLGDQEARLASGVLDGATYTVTARGASVASGTSVLEQPVTVTSTCQSPDGTAARVVIQGQALARSAFEVPFCACGDVTAGDALSVAFPGTDGADPDATARLVLAANGSIRLGSATVQGGVIAGEDLRGVGMPAGGSYAGGENAMQGTSHVLPTPRPCRCDEVAVNRELPQHAPAAPAAPVAPATATGKGARTKAPPAGAPAGSLAVAPARCDRYLADGRLEVPAGITCELGGGRLALTRLVVGEGARIVVGAPARLELSGDGPFEVGAGGRFDAVTAGDLAITSTTAADLRLGGGGLRAWVFAPQARVVLGDGARFEGVLAVGHLDLGRDVHLDADRRAADDAIYVADFREDDWRLAPAGGPAAPGQP